jgi:hypothetical protein
VLVHRTGGRRLLGCAWQHKALVKATLRALRQCDVTTLDLSTAKGVTDDWLGPMVNKGLTALDLSNCVEVSRCHSRYGHRLNRRLTQERIHLSRESSPEEEGWSRVGGFGLYPCGASGCLVGR